MQKASKKNLEVLFTSEIHFVDKKFCLSLRLRLCLCGDFPVFLRNMVAALDCFIQIREAKPSYGMIFTCVCLCEWTEAAVNIIQLKDSDLV